MGAQTVTHTSYVRVLPSPWPSGAVPTAAQVDVLLASSEPDALAVAMQYIHGQPTVKVADANAYTGYLWVSGDAGYGPDIGADFNDHLGVSWDYGASYGGIDPNETAEYGLLDCSGFIRMVFGYRMGIPLAKIGHERPGVAIPRTSALQSSSGTSIGVGVIADTGRKPTSFDNLSPGDIVFFDADGADGTIDHVGIYLGIDSSGKNRVLSSRNSLLGPTMKDSASATRPPFKLKVQLKKRPIKTTTTWGIGNVSQCDFHRRAEHDFCTAMPVFRLKQLVVVVVAAFSYSAYAQSPPNVGQVLESVRELNTIPARPDAEALQFGVPQPVVVPAEAVPNDEPKVHVRAFRLRGNTVFTEAELQPLIAAGTGRSLDLEGSSKSSRESVTTITARAIFWHAPMCRRRKSRAAKSKSPSPKASSVKSKFNAVRQCV